MKYTIKSSSQLRVTLFDDKPVYLDSDLEADIKFPLEVVITPEDAAIYTYKDECFLDYNPGTLGYYWIEGNKCLRTTKGLIFKATKKEKAVQTRATTDGTLAYQSIDWKNSIKPTDQKEYTFEKVENLKALLNKSATNKWYLEIDTKRVNIMLGEFEFFHEHDKETEFELINGIISYYGRPVLGVDISSFKVLNCNYAMDKNYVYTFKQGKFVIDRKREE